MEKRFRKSFRVVVTIAAKDLECAEELYELYDITEYDKHPFSHVLKVEVDEAEPTEEVILDADGTEYTGDIK